MNPFQKQKLECVLNDGCKITGTLARKNKMGVCEYCAVGEILHFVGVPDDWLMKFTSVATAVKDVKFVPFIKAVEEKFGLGFAQLHQLEGLNDSQHNVDERRKYLAKKLDQIAPPTGDV